MEYMFTAFALWILLFLITPLIDCYQGDSVLYQKLVTATEVEV